MVGQHIPDFVLSTELASGSATTAYKQRGCPKTHVHMYTQK